MRTTLLVCRFLVAAFALTAWLSAGRDSQAALVGYFTFDGNLSDASGVGNHGTFTGGSPVYVGDRFGNPGSAIQFDGVNDRVTIGTNGRGTNSFTFGGWIQTSLTHEIDAQANNTTAGTGGQRYAFGAYNGGGGGEAGSGMSIGTNGISVYEHANSYMPPLAVFNPGDETTVGAGWNHVMVVYDGEKQPAIYLNGVRVHTGLKSPKTPRAPFEIGGGSYGYLNGVMDDVVFYNHALSTSQIQALAAGGSPFDIGISILNPSFEDAPYPSGVGYGDIPGWTGGGGVNPSSDPQAPFLNGLTPPHGTHVGFIQMNGAMSQTVVGLTPGRQYVLEYYQDERGLANAVAGPSASIDGNPVVSQMELICTPQFRRVVSKPFTATDVAAVLELRNTSTQGDNTLLVDNVSIRPVGIVLLQDNFDLRNNPATPGVPVGNYDVNAGLAGRQAGMFAGTRYVETAHSATGAVGDQASQVDMAAAPDALMLGANAGLGAAFTAVSPNFDFGLNGLDVRRTIIEFDVDPYMPGSGSGDNWASVRFGDTAPLQHVAAAGGGVGILFREGGAFEAFDGATYLGSGTAFAGAGFRAIRIEVDALAFDGSPATIAAFADGNTTPFFTYSKPSGFLGNYITLGGYSGASADMLHGFDNLMITVEHVPEPATLAMLLPGLLLALGAVWRKRRR